MPCKAVINKMSLDLKKLETILTSKRIILKKIINVWKGKREFAKIKGSICNIPIQGAYICNILLRPADSNRLIVVKLKRGFQYRGYVYFEPVRPNFMYQALIF